MDYELLIRYGFKAFVEKKFEKEEIQKFLLDHERLPLMVSNLAIELKNTEFIISKQVISQEQKRESIKNIITDFSKIFCVAAIDEIAKKRGVDDSKSFKERPSLKI